MILILTAIILSCGISTDLDKDKGAPSNLTARITLYNEICLSWKDNSSEELGFIIARQKDGSEFTIIDTVGVNIQDYFDGSVIENSFYTYRVAAFFEDGISDWSNEVSLVHKFFFGDLAFGTETTFDVITWNIENFPKAGQTTVDYLSFAILASAAEVFALQEIESESYFAGLLEKINEMDTIYVWEGYRASSASYEINLAYIYNSELVQVYDIYEIYQNDWYAFPRPPLVMECSYADKEFVVINNHYKASGGNDNELRRKMASEKLDQYISLEQAESNVILLGDLNDDITEPEVSNVFWVFISQPEFYLFADMDIAQGSVNFWSYPSWPSHLDHILISNELFDIFENDHSICQTILMDTFLSGGWGEYDQNISDHRPVGLRLYWE
jgi:endonuclease/exonuclease/phosphatase family metal-dependent hydrolase